MMAQTKLKLEITVNWILNNSYGLISWLRSTCCIISIIFHLPTMCIFLAHCFHPSWRCCWACASSSCLEEPASSCHWVWPLGVTPWLIRTCSHSGRRSTTFHYWRSVTCVNCWRFRPNGFGRLIFLQQTQISCEITFSKPFSYWFCTQLCRVPVYASVSGRGHLVFLHRAQPGTGRTAQNKRFVTFKLADMQDPTFKMMVCCLPELMFSSAFTET